MILQEKEVNGFGDFCLENWLIVKVCKNEKFNL